MTGDATVVVRLSVEPGHVLELAVYGDGMVAATVVRSVPNTSGEVHANVEERCMLGMLSPQDVELACGYAAIVRGGPRCPECGTIWPRIEGVPHLHGASCPVLTMPR